MKFFGKELKFNNNKIYHSGDKPTPSEIGAAPTSHNHQASQVTFTDGKTFQQKLDDGSLRGPKGDTGATGAKGATGATGAQGPAGVTPTIKAGTVTTGNAGTNAAVTASTSGTTTTFNFTIPKGATGAQGPKGDTGATGPQGPQGVKGDTGAKGATGATGAKGVSMRFKGAWSSTTAYVNDSNYIDLVTSNGNTYACKTSHTNQAVTNTTYWEIVAQKGDKGATGSQGPQGLKGDTGATGLQGPKGDKGATGPQGPAGAKGADGLTTSVTVGSTKYTHSNGNITIPAYPTALKNPSALTLQFNGTTNKTYDGSSAQTLNITPAAIGAAASSHGTHVTYGGNGSATTVSRSDHSHNVVKDIGDGQDITLAYSKAGLTSASWFAAWNGRELRAMAPNDVRNTIGAAASSHGRHMPDVCETITDWNNATKPGWYMGNNAANGPTTVASGGTVWYFGKVICHNSNYVIQEVYQFTASTDAKAIPKYIRAKMNGTWGAWTNVTVAKAVPSNAVFTDTNTWRGVQDNLTSTATDQSLSANQGKVLKGLIDGKANSSHGTHVTYGGNGSATTVSRSDHTHTGYASSSHTHNFLEMKGTNTINSTANDTTANWGAHKNSVH